MINSVYLLVRPVTAKVSLTSLLEETKMEEEEEEVVVVVEEAAACRCRSHRSAGLPWNRGDRQSTRERQRGRR